MAEDGRTVVVYATRGNRGEDINRRNASSLADLVAEHGVSRLIVTASTDVAATNDQATASEIEAARHALVSRYQRFDWFDELERATAEALATTRPGDLIVLLGAQGMNEGRRLLSSAGTSPQEESTYRS
jgi:UDP-N-acetylmuramoyl-L-alanyl-D-glutamate--2,6-diaminopimelate ligase